ncbi:hypothetical protein [Sphingobium sp. B2]|uniref:hypothetical protein n=1 Tax=Sphingobium sp. B2 TaxID=2583228 RepID=UPI0011A2789A|nr:hypothetical protein [Sphingobium sp. B2]
MAGTNPFIMPAILLAAVLTACGQNAATAEAETENATETPALLENVGASTEDAANTATAAAVETAAPDVPAQATATLATLPLKRGYYVRSETPCNRASRADVFSLVTRTGMNLNCTFKRIEKTGATTYRVTQECANEGAAWGRADETETSTDTYEIPNETSYKVTYDGGYEASARYCAQSSMPPGYSDNDISDVTG